MRLRNPLLLITFSLVFISCWKWKYPNNSGTTPPKVWGYKPVYGSEPDAKKISYVPSPHAVVAGGNIYAFRNYIFQIETGYGIHVIDNSDSHTASRIGFITVNGCAQISIKGDKIYTNSYDDLIIIDFSDLNNVHEISRLKGAFSEYRFDSPLAMPVLSGYFECPVYGKFVIGWTQDSVYKACYKPN